MADRSMIAPQGLALAPQALEESWRTPAGTEVPVFPDAAALDAAMLEAHAARDLPALVGLYTSAADRAEAEDRVEAACFYLTHAYVYALEAGDPLADRLHARLVARGRDE